MGLLNCRSGDLVIYEELSQQQSEISFCGGGLKVAHFMKRCGAKLVCQARSALGRGTFQLIAYCFALY